MVKTNLFLRKRITVVFLLLAAVFFLFLFRLIWIQLVKGNEFQEKAEGNRLREVKVEAKRGTIYDTNMSELAISVSTDYVYAIPPEVIRSGEAEKIAKEVAKILELSEDEVYKKITKNGSWFEYLKRRVEHEKALKIKELDLPGIFVAEESQRFYPNGSLCAHVLGFAGIDNQGLEGIETTYDEVLRGKNGAIMIEFDGQGKPLPNAEHRYIPAEDGNSIVLTIDGTIQYIAERELDAIMNSEASPESATIIFMEPKTGRIRALASRPTYDPNKFAEYDQKVWRNTAVSNVYEPGSTFKIITTAASLEENIVDRNKSFHCSGYIKIGPNRVRCWRHYNPHGSQTFAEAVENSCNPVFISLGLSLEEKKKGLLYDYVENLGFGKKTNVDLPGEAEGILISRDSLKDINVATISMGQGIAVTPIQLVTAVSAIANGGTLMKPQIVEKILDKEGNVIKEFKPEVVKTVISEETSKEVLSILEGVVSKGTGRNAYIEGYRVGGKTGTAQKPGKGGYQQGKYIASFLGVAPVDDPKLVGLVIIDEPKSYPYYGGTLAAPIFKSVMEDALKHLKVPPQYSEEERKQRELEEEIVELPDLRGLSKERVEHVLESLGLKVKFMGNGNYVLSQDPAKGSKVKKGTNVVIYLGNKNKKGETVRVPDLTGKRIAPSAKLLEAMGLKLIPQGNGKAIKQEPAPFTEVPVGSEVKVFFKDEIVETMGP